MLQTYIESLKEKESEKKFLQNELQNWETKQDNYFQNLEHLETARSIIQKASKATQIYLQTHVSTIVTNALKAVFQDDAYEFKINFVNRRNSTECDLILLKDEKEYKPLESCGYGVADIVALALRIVYWKLHSNLRNTLIWDEPCRNCSLDLHPLISLMLQQLSKSLNLQMIIVTHSKSLSQNADKVFSVKKINNKSIIKGE